MKYLLLLMLFVFPITNIQGEIKDDLSLNLDQRKRIDANFEYKLEHIEYTKSYVSHASIEISSDEDFENFSLSGIGTVSDPYVIANYNISTTNTTGILIQDTTKYFKIENCIIDADSKGIGIENVTTGTATIKDNICINNIFTGIYARDAPNTQIVNNTCNSNNHYGMRIIDCNETEIKSNYCKNNPWGGITVESCYKTEIKNNILVNNTKSAGILVDYSDDAIIENNTCINNEQYGIRLRTLKGALILKNFVNNSNTCIGIELFDSSGVSLLNNTILSDKSSIYLVNSLGTEIKHNEMHFSGLAMSGVNSAGFSSFDIQDNLVNGKKLGFFNNIEYSTFSEPNYGQLILTNSQEITIENQGPDNKFIGVTLHFCYGITLQNSATTSLVNDSRIITWGIKIYDSENINVLESICKDGGWGIYLRGVKNSMIKSNICENNFGIGILAIDSEEISIINNTCFQNGYGGIVLSDSNYCNIEYNHLKNNGYSESFSPGLRLDFNSDHNIIHHNAFVNNTHNGSSQVVDDGESNIWYDISTLEGNFYDDYIGSGSYLIYGYSNSSDPYPLSEVPIYTEPRRTTYNSVMMMIPLLAYISFRSFIRRMRNNRCEGNERSKKRY